MWGLYIALCISILGWLLTIGIMIMTVKSVHKYCEEIMREVIFMRNSYLMTRKQLFEIKNKDIYRSREVVIDECGK